MIQPPRVGPITGASKAATPKRLWAAPCFSAGKLSSRMLWLEGWRPPPARPCITRKRINWPRLVAIPQSTELMVKTAIEIRK